MGLPQEVTSIYLKEENKSFSKTPANSDLQFPMKVKVMTKEETNVYHSRRRRRIILDYATKQRQRTATEKENDFEELSEEQQRWKRRRMTGPDWTWTRWNGIEEVWTPWDACGQPINSSKEIVTKWATIQ